MPASPFNEVPASQPDPLSSYNESQKIAIRKQAEMAMQSGKLNPKQKQSVSSLLNRLQPARASHGASGGWEPTSPGLKDFKAGPVARESLLGAASGLGIPETMTPVKDFLTNTAMLFAVGPTRQDTDPLGRVLSYVPVIGPAYRAGAGAGESLYESGKQTVQAKTPEEMAHGAAQFGTTLFSLAKGIEKTPEFEPPTKTSLAARIRKMSKELYVKETAPKDLTKPVGEGMQTAKIIGTKKAQFQQLKQRIAQNMYEVDARVKQSTASGAKADVSLDLDNAYNIARERAILLKDTEGLNALTKWKYRQGMVVRPDGSFAPQNLKAMDANALYRETVALQHDTGWEGRPTPAAVQQASKIYRDALGKHLDRIAPGVQRLQHETAGLIEARGSYGDMGRFTGGLGKQIQDSLFNKTKTFVSYFNNKGTMAAYAFLWAAGADWMTRIAATSLMTTFWQMPLSRSTRAYLLARIGDLIEERRRPAAQGPQSQPQGGPISGPGPQNVPSAPTGQSAAPAPTGAPQVPVQQQLALPPSAQTVGTPAGAVTATSLFQQAKAQLGPGATVREIAQKATELEKTKFGGGVSARGDYAASIKETPAYKEAIAKAEQTGRVAEGVSGMSPKTKAMLDRLDELTQRQPKSGAERVAIEREIGDIKKAVAKGTSVEEQRAINERIGARERQARLRARNRAEAPTEQTPIRATRVAGLSPEDSALLREQGYNELSQLPEGKSAAAALRRQAKAQRWDAVTETTALAEVLEFLRSQQGKH